MPLQVFQGIWPEDFIAKKIMQERSEVSRECLMRENRVPSHPLVSVDIFDAVQITYRGKPR